MTTSTKAGKVRIEGGKRYYKDAWMEKRDGLYILHLKGTPYEVGYQHGILMSEEIKDGAVKLYADPIFRGKKSYSPLSFFIKAFLKLKIYKPIEKAQPRDVIDQLKGIADGSGVPYKTIFRGNHHTAVYMVMTPTLVKKNLKVFNKLGIQIGACSTFVTAKDATLNGKTIVGRNTDYSEIEKWPKYQTIMFVEPGNGFKYVQIGTAGVILWAPGMNEKGIVVCGHYMIYDDIAPNGWSIAAFTDAFLKSAETLEDAIEILNSNPRGISGGFVITDGKTKDAFAAEVSTGKATIRRMENNRLVMTNMAITEEKRAIDFVVRYNVNEGCPGRYRRLLQLIDQNYGKIDPNLAAEFMGDHIRFSTNAERNAYGIIAVDDNVNSMVFSPEDLKLWVASGLAPVCNNKYLGMDFEKEMNGKQYEMELKFLEGYKFLNSNKRLASQIFNKAYILHEEDPTLIQDMLKYIQEAIDLDPEEIIFYQMSAKLLLHQGQYDRGIAILSQAFNYKQSLNEKAHSNLLMGILNDLKGERKNAISYYQKIEDLTKIEPEDPWFKVNKFVGAYSQRYFKSPFTNKDLKDRSVLVDFAQGAGVE